MKVLRDNLQPVINSPLINDFRPSFAVDLEVLPEDLDDLGHMNNAVYLNWLDQSHLAHTFHLGVTPERMRASGCALVVRHVDLVYLGASRLGEIARVGTCIADCDCKLRLQRRFQMVLRESGKTVLRGHIDYISVDFQKGRPMRMPGDYAEAFTAARSVL